MPAAASPLDQELAGLKRALETARLEMVRKQALAEEKARGTTQARGQDHRTGTAQEKVKVAP